MDDEANNTLQDGKPGPASVPSVIEPFPKEAELLAQMLSRGLRLLEACQHLQIEPAQAQTWLIRPDFDSLLQKHVPEEKEIRDKFDRLAAPAVATLKRLMEDENTKPSTRAAIAKDLLDRAGYSPIKKIAVVSFKADQTKADMLRSTAREAFVELIPEETP